MYLIIKETTRMIGNYSSKKILGYKADEDVARKVVDDLKEQELSRKNNGLAYIDYYYEKIDEFKEE